MDSAKSSLCASQRQHQISRTRPAFAMARADASLSLSESWVASDEESASESSSGDESGSGRPLRRQPGRCSRSDSRSTRTSTGSRKKLREFLGDLLETGEVEGLKWIDRKAKSFKMPWRHANKRGNGYVAERDTKLTMLWALNTQKYDPEREEPEPSRWKTNFRCALNSLRHSIVEVENREARGYKVYRFDDSRRGRGRAMRAERAEMRRESLQSLASAAQQSLSFPAQPQAAPSAYPRSTIKDMLPESRAISTASLFSLASELSAPSSSQSSVPPQPDDSDLVWSNDVTGGLAPQCSIATTHLTSDFLCDLSPSINANDLMSLHDAVDFPPLPAMSGMSCNAPMVMTEPYGSNDDYLSFSSQPNWQTTAQTRAGATPPLEDSSESGLYVSVNYRQNTVAACEVKEHGCRLFSGDQSYNQKLSHDHYTRMYGNCKMKQLSLPAPPAAQRCLQSLQQLIGDGGHDPGYMVRGLCFEVENDDIYATRLCQPRVFWGPVNQSNGEHLIRGVRTRIFEYSTFKTLLEDYQHNSSWSAIIASQAPAHTVQLCVGQPWGDSRLVANNLLSISITHAKAERLVAQMHADKWMQGEPLNTDHLVVDPPTADDNLARSLSDAPLGAVPTPEGSVS